MKVQLLRVYKCFLILAFLQEAMDKMPSDLVWRLKGALVDDLDQYFPILDPQVPWTAIPRRLQAIVVLAWGFLSCSLRNSRNPRLGPTDLNAALLNSLCCHRIPSKQRNWKHLVYSFAYETPSGHSVLQKLTWEKSSGIWWSWFTNNVSFRHGFSEELDMCE